MKLNKTIWLLGLFVSTFAFSQEETLTLYTQRHYEVDKKVHALFQEKTGIRIDVVKAGADELIARLEEEGDSTKADLFMTADGGSLDRARRAGVLQPVSDESISALLPARLQDPEGHWFAVTQRARVIVHSKDRVKPEDLSTYEDLANEKWRGRIVIRSSSNVYNQSLLSTMIAANGRDASVEWASAVRKNMARPPQGSDRDQIRAIAAGLADVALVNTYYVGLLETSDIPADREAAAAVRIFFPNQDGRGAHMNISGIGITAATEKKELAVKFLRFLLSSDAQSMYPNSTSEYPVAKSIPWSDLQKGWGEFKPDPVSLSVMGSNNADAVRVFNEAGWE